MNKPFELLVFDWDGTLMDSEAHIVASMKSAIVDVELPELPHGCSPVWTRFNMETDGTVLSNTSG